MAGIIIALGANLPSPAGAPPQTFAAACNALRDRGFVIARRAPLFRSAAVPKSDQPDFFNTCILAFATLPPPAVMGVLHAVEQRFGRERRTLNEARPLDLDLIDYEGRVSTEGEAGPVLPHPRMLDRGFVLRPMAHLVPAWRHPRTGEKLATLIARLPFSDDTVEIQETAWLPT